MAPPERAGLDPGALRRMVHEVSGLHTGGRPWCAGAVLLAGRGPMIAVEEAFGWAERYRAYDPRTDSGVELPAGQWRPMGTGTPFDLASLTKLFTTVAVMQQIER